MYLADGLMSSFQTILSHKLRSFLTLIGIMIGVAAVVTMFSSIYGIKKIISNNMEGMGWNYSVIVTPSTGQQTQFGRSRHYMRSFMYMNRGAKPLTYSDYQVLKQTLTLKEIYGMIETQEMIMVNQKEQPVRLRGSHNNFFRSKTYPLMTGRLFSKFDEDKAEKVCIVGPYFSDEFLAGDNPLDKMITIGSMRYKIIGVLKNDQLNKGSGFNFNPWERKQDLKCVYIPLSTASKYLRSSGAIDYIYCQASDDASFSKMKASITQTLKARHKMAHDFAFQDIGAFMLTITQEMEKMMKKWNITLIAIASISLLVGGIGLFSTLLISINERMTEIGVRKSIGATEFDIFFYFILEAITLAMLGAFAGIFFSALLIKIMGMLIKMSMPIPMSGVILGLSFAFLIGFFSGLYPSIRAAKINPIQAIFYFD